MRSATFNKADDTQTAPGYSFLGVHSQSNNPNALCADNHLGHVIVTQENKPSALLPTTAPNPMLLVHNFQKRFEHSSMDQTQHELKKFIECRVACKSSDQVREKVWLSRRNYVTARYQKPVTVRPRPKRCRLCQLSPFPRLSYFPFFSI